MEYYRKLIIKKAFHMKISMEQNIKTYEWLPTIYHKSWSNSVERVLVAFLEILCLLRQMGGGGRKSEKWGGPNDDCNLNTALHSVDSEAKRTMFFRDIYGASNWTTFIRFLFKKVCWNVRNKFYRNSKLKTLS